MNFLPRIMKRANELRASEIVDDGRDSTSDLIDNAAVMIAILQIRGDADRKAEADAEQQREIDRQKRVKEQEIEK